MNHADRRPRARDLGIDLDGTPGPWNAITDVPGVEVGHLTLIEGHGPLVVGAGPVRTGVTAILPRGRAGVGVACAAGWTSFNGNGEMTGTAWIEESGALEVPVLLTDTHAVGACHTGALSWMTSRQPSLGVQWLLPVVSETWNGYLSDINGGHVRPEHAHQALDAASSGPVAEGSVGGGTGMNCYGFKGGVGTSSRLVDAGGHRYTVGAQVQANFGARAELVVAGHRIGRTLLQDNPLESTAWLERDGARRRSVGGAGSVVVLVATDAPLLPGQCKALSRRVALGLARTGTTGSHFSGDLFLAFSTANEGALASQLPTGDPQSVIALERLEFLPWPFVDPLYTAVVESVEESVLNALTAAQEMVGRDGHRSPALPHQALRRIFQDAPGT